ncbi:hypothetical protein [Pedobacter arcticus]|uniref:hypothetical protein n=1 Tax=Pedobacter arcticus TaxID=752140 RepID=UPI0003061D44|nr:hypothetical protein [Pedobacter arcticus]
MKTLDIQFVHPVQGRVQLRNKATKTVKNFTFISDENFTVHIKSKDLADGNWSASLEWNHDKQLFLIEKNFKVINEKVVQSV